MKALLVGTLLITKYSVFHQLVDLGLGWSTNLPSCWLCHLPKQIWADSRATKMNVNQGLHGLPDQSHFCDRSKTGL